MFRFERNLLKNKRCGIIGTLGQILKGLAGKMIICQRRMEINENEIRNNEKIYIGTV